MTPDKNEKAKALDLALSHIERQFGRGSLMRLGAAGAAVAVIPTGSIANVLKRGEEVVGNRTRVRVVKNKLAPPLRQAEFDVLYGQGVSRLGELLDLALPQGS